MGSPVGFALSPCLFLGTPGAHSRGLSARGPRNSFLWPSPWKWLWSRHPCLFWALHAPQSPRESQSTLAYLKLGKCWIRDPAQKSGCSQLNSICHFVKGPEAFFSREWKESESLFFFLTCESVRCSVVSNSVWPRGLAHQAPLSVGFSRQEYGSGLPFPPPGDLPNPEAEPRSPSQQADSLPSATVISH